MLFDVQNVVFLKDVRLISAFCQLIIFTEPIVYKIRVLQVCTYLLVRFYSAYCVEILFVRRVLHPHHVFHSIRKCENREEYN